MIAVKIDIAHSKRVNTYYFSIFRGNKNLFISEKSSYKLPEKTKENSDPLVEKLATIIDSNLNNEQFGVEQLAKEIGISRSHLHRKVHKITGNSISQFIREYRLTKAKNLLIEKEVSASEVAIEVGFSSASYFSKSFTDFYGYPPSKVKQNQSLDTEHESIDISKKRTPFKRYQKISIVVLSMILISSFFYFKNKPNITGITKDRSNSILVLPFKNLSNKIENQYLADGMVDAITRNLTSIKEINVISFLSINLNNDEQGIFKEIKKNHKNINILIGSIQKRNEVFRVEVKLVNSYDDELLWSKNYDSRSLDVLKIQNDIAIEISNSLEINFTRGEKQILDKRITYNPIAYDNFTKGWFHFNQFSSDGQLKAKNYFEEAIAADSTLALAHLGIGMYYQVKASVWGAELTTKEAFLKASPYLNRALKLDPDLKEAHGWRAFEKLFANWNFKEAEDNYKISIKSKFPVYLALYANFLHYENRHEEGYEIAKKLNDEYPYYLNNQMVLSYYFTNKYEEGREFIKTRLKAYSNYYTYDTSGFFMLNTGDYDGAISLFNKAIDLEGNRFPRMLGWMGAAYAKKGDQIKATKFLNELKELKLKTDAGSPAFFCAIIHAALGEKEQALTFLETAVNDHEMEVPWLVSEPQLYPLHKEPEFIALVKKVGFRPHAFPIKN